MTELPIKNLDRQSGMTAIIAHPHLKQSEGLNNVNASTGISKKQLISFEASYIPQVLIVAIFSLYSLMKTSTIPQEVEKKAWNGPNTMKVEQQLTESTPSMKGVTIIAISDPSNLDFDHKDKAHNDVYHSDNGMTCKVQSDDNDETNDVNYSPSLI